MNIIDKIVKKVGVYNFDPSDTDLIIAGYTMSDYTGVTLTPNQRRRTEQGIDPLYHTYVDLPSYCDLSVTILPACPDLQFMEDLQDALELMKGYFEVTLKQNGRFIGTYDCYFKNDSADVVSGDANDKTYEMVAVKQNDSVFRVEDGLDL